MRSRGRASLTVLLLALLGATAFAAACSRPKSFIVVTLRSARANQLIPGVASVEVTVTQGTSFSTTLTYPVSGQPLTLDQSTDNTLSVSFAGARSGAVLLAVVVKDGAGCAIGAHDGTSVTIRQGDVASAVVDLDPRFDCVGNDGGVDAPAIDAFPGCDPAAPGAVCSATQTCQINCMVRKGECTAGGKGAPGASCMTNKDCAPGSQCFDYTNTGCGVKICLRFCGDDNVCQGGGAGADGGASTDGGASGADGGVTAFGTASVCQGLVPCGQSLTAYHTCTFACDPRQKAVAGGTSGCPTGLSCLVVGDRDQVDCACPEKSRTRVDGQDCASGGGQCAPGFICNEMGTTKTCRALCRCNRQDTKCTAPSDDCAGGKTCQPLLNDTVFGVCL